MFATVNQVSVIFFQKTSISIPIPFYLRIGIEIGFGSVLTSLIQGYTDFSANPHINPGLVCKKRINECQNPSLNTCSEDAICIDTIDSYKCLCKASFVDLDELRNPGRQCQKIHRNEMCEIGKNDCDKKARCIVTGDNEFKCVCPPGINSFQGETILGIYTNLTYLTFNFVYHIYSRVHGQVT